MLQACVRFNPDNTPYLHFQEGELNNYSRWDVQDPDAARRLAIAIMRQEIPTTTSLYGSETLYAVFTDETPPQERIVSAPFVGKVVSPK